MNTLSTAPDSRKSLFRRATAAGARVAERGIALALSLLLLRTAFVHLGNPYYFLSTVYSYQISGIEAGKWMALLAPSVQIVVAVCLLSRCWIREAYVLACLVFLVFLTAQVSTLARGMKISCGCFGATENLPIGKETLIFTGIAAGLSLAGLLLTFMGGGRKATPVETPTQPSVDAQPVETAKL
jgi:hypothetical protein